MTIPYIFLWDSLITYFNFANIIYNKSWMFFWARARRFCKNTNAMINFLTGPTCQKFASDLTWNMHASKVGETLVCITGMFLRAGLKTRVIAIVVQRVSALRSLTASKADYGAVTRGN